MTQFFHDCLQSKRCLLIVLIALLYSTQAKLEAQSCDPDTIPPVAVCGEFYTVPIGNDAPGDCYGLAGPNNQPAAFGPKKGTGVKWVKANVFDQGSYDACGANLKFTVRRKTPYSNAILALNATNGHGPCDDVFPDFPSEFERAISEQDSIKFYAEEAGTSQQVILRVYQLNPNGTFAIHPGTGMPLYNECIVIVDVEDKTKPVCTPPADVTVTCEQFDPTMAAYGLATVTDNACVDTTLQSLNLANFDTSCHRGTIVRIFTARDCSNNTSSCSQRIVVNYAQNYFVKFPNDVITANLSPNGVYGEPTFFAEDCELMGVNYNDEVSLGDPDANIRINRTWTIVNWCTYDPLIPFVTVPNPNPNAIPNHPTNLPGPIVSAPGTSAPWASSVVKITPLDASPTDYSTFWSADVNRYNYTQVIKIIDTFYVGVQGVVFSDTSANCNYETGEPLLTEWTVRATGLTTGQVKEATTDATGHFAFVFNGIDTVINLTLVSAGNFGQGCQTNYNVNCQVGNIENKDIPVHLEERCALMSVGIATPILRRCFGGNRYTVEACNLSGATVADAYVEVDLDNYLEYTTASIPGTLVSGNKYRFELGDLPAGDCRRIWVETYVNCNAPLGYTHCTEARIYPYDDCRTNANWSGADVDVTAACDGDSVRLTMLNVGDGAMAQQLDFVVAEDIIMRQTGQFQLGVGEQYTVSYPANGSTWRLEAQEEPLHPFGGVQAVALEGCGGLNQTGLVNIFPLSDANPFIGNDCTENRGAFDPNDKQGFPLGIGSNHYMQSNTDLEYLVRFQNTGTDTAFTVRVLDTLSQYLDPASVRVLATSHPAEFAILEGNVVQFLFNNILLPDSNINQAASNGFLKFRIAQKTDMPEGTRIENTAHIYFDFNEAVVTNTTFHTINNHPLTVGIDDPLNVGSHVKVFPNPTADEATFLFENVITNGRFELKNQIGQSVRFAKFTGTQYRFERAGLQSGIYFFSIMQENGATYTGKILVK